MHIDRDIENCTEDCSSDSLQGRKAIRFQNSVCDSPEIGCMLILTYQKKKPSSVP